MDPTQEVEVSPPATGAIARMRFPKRQPISLVKPPPLLWPVTKTRLESNVRSVGSCAISSSNMRKSAVKSHCLMPAALGRASG